MSVVLALIFISLCFPVIFCGITAYFASRSTANGLRLPWRAYWKETLVIARLMLTAPLEAIRPWKSGGLQARHVVLLLPGYLETQVVFSGIIRRLEAMGSGIKVIRYPSLLGDIQEMVRQVKDEMAAVHGQNPEAALVLVGHSMGGLVARVVAEEGFPGLMGVVMITVPHQGSELARFGFGYCARQMEPGSDFLSRLSTTVIQNSVNIVSGVDNIVYPEFRQLYHKNNRVISSPTLHVSTLFSEEVMTIIEEKVLMWTKKQE